MLREIVKQCFTEPDNVTHDLYKYLSLAAIVTGLGMQIYAVGWNHQPFDMQAFGLGTGSLFAGVGVALAIKKDTPS